MKKSEREVHQMHEELDDSELDSMCGGAGAVIPDRDATREFTRKSQAPQPPSSPGRLFGR